MGKIIEIISKHIGMITLIVIFLFFVTSYFSNQYDLLAKTYEFSKNHTIFEKTVWFLAPKQQILLIVNSFLLNLSIALIITFFIVRYLEKREKENFYNKLQEFQKDTARDAIRSVFERIIEPEFFKIIEYDVLNAKFIRHNVKWDYDFCINEHNKLELKRTIIYTLKNITSNDEVEKFKVVTENNVHTNIIEIDLKYKKENENEYKKVEFKKEEKNNRLEAYEDINIDAYEQIQVIISWKEVFKCDYAYATHLIKFPIIDLELNVNFPKEYNFDIIVDSFSNKLEKIYGPVDGKIKYKANGGLYKGQGIEFILYKKDNMK